MPKSIFCEREFDEKYWIVTHFNKRIVDQHSFLLVEGQIPSENANEPPHQFIGQYDIRVQFANECEVIFFKIASLKSEDKLITEQIETGKYWLNTYFFVYESEISNGKLFHYQGCSNGIKEIAVSAVKLLQETLEQFKSPKENDNNLDSLQKTVTACIKRYHDVQVYGGVVSFRRFNKTGVIKEIGCKVSRDGTYPFQYGLEQLLFSRSYTIERNKVEKIINSIHQDIEQINNAKLGKADYIPYQRIGSVSLFGYGVDGGGNCCEWVNEKLKLAHIRVDTKWSDYFIVKPIKHAFNIG